ncbi:hypothetical protein BVG19_g582 [[Candida] boidinii]|nr:hypothetical protein BVG19_g582 [[Candida] boidinii]OWB51491.1 hypothetical protein B5S27_g3054 [[Candida] boidinii]
MSTRQEVQIFKTEIQILSIPRKNYWLFQSGVLLILHKLANITNKNSHAPFSYSDLDFDDDEDDVSNDDAGNITDGSSNASVFSNQRKHSGGSIVYSPFSTTTTTNQVQNASSTASTTTNTNNNRSNRNSHNFQNYSNNNNTTNTNTSTIYSPNYSPNISQISSPITPGSFHAVQQSNDYEIEDDGYFFHLAFSPDEVTIMCSKEIMNQFLATPIDASINLNLDVELLPESFLILQVVSDGESGGKRILELTEPLAKKDIPLFFISNHFSDIVLIPSEQKNKSIEILKNNNFVLTKDNDDLNFSGYNSKNFDNFKGFTFKDSFNTHNITNDDVDDDKGKIIDDENGENSDIDDLILTDSTIKEKSLNEKTFQLFKDSKIVPYLNTRIKLLLNGIKSSYSSKNLKLIAETLSKSMVSFNTSTPPTSSSTGLNIFPQYFAITRTPTGEIGLLLPQNYKCFNFNISSLSGSKNDFFHPLAIDLKKLPTNSKGIVAGVAIDLANDGVNEMNYLSFGKSGVVMIPGEYSDNVRESLNRHNLN